MTAGNGEDKRPFVVFGTPSLYADVCFPFVQSILETCAKLGALGIDWGFILSPGDPYLAKVRNSIATRFLLEYPQATHLFFLDSDIGWDADGAVKLITSRFDVTAGIYPKKSDPIEFPCELYLDAPEGSFVERDGFFKANAVPTGFLCIKRHVIERMCKGRGVYRDLDGKLKFNPFQMGFSREETGEMDPNDPMYPLWVQMGREALGQWWGEDYAWCRQWRDMGGDLWVYPDIAFSHNGRKAWSANFAPSVKAFMDGRVVFRDARPAMIVKAAQENAA